MGQESASTAIAAGTAMGNRGKRDMYDILEYLSTGLLDGPIYLRSGRVKLPGTSS